MGTPEKPETDFKAILKQNYFFGNKWLSSQSSWILGVLVEAGKKVQIEKLKWSVNFMEIQIMQ